MNYIQRRLKTTCTIDGFATSENKRMKKFFSKYPQVGTSGLDFFSMELLEGEVYWLCPPVKEVVRTINRIRTCGSEIKAIISFPNWKGADFWPKLLQNRQTWKRDVQDAMLT